MGGIIIIINPQEIFMIDFDEITKLNARCDRLYKIFYKIGFVREGRISKKENIFTPKMLKVSRKILDKINVLEKRVEALANLSSYL